MRQREAERHDLEIAHPLWICGGLERTPVSGASFFTGFGFAFGPLGLGLLGFQVDAELLRTLESRSRGARRRRPRRPAAQPPPGAKAP